jgi:hypothetical protein
MENLSSVDAVPVAGRFGFGFLGTQLEQCLWTQ